MVGSETIARESSYEQFKAINYRLPDFGKTLGFVRNKSGKAVSYSIKFTHIGTFKFHIGKIIGEDKINLVKEHRITKEKVKVGIQMKRQQKLITILTKEF